MGCDEWNYVGQILFFTVTKTDRKTPWPSG
jgi:hypothetical protein